MKNIDLLVDHPDYCIINKPAGIGVHKDENGEGLLPILLPQLAIDKLWLVHRLDKLTSGCMILAKNAQAAATFGALFSQRKINKYYIAICAKKPAKKQGTVTGDMKKSRDGKWILTAEKDNPAISQFFSKGLFDGKRLVMIKPRTGKTHQIRVMLKSQGAPILGDSHYGGTQSDRMYLHAYGLTFHYQQQPVQVFCYPQQGDNFRTMLEGDFLQEFSHPEQLSWPHIKLARGKA